MGTIMSCVNLITSLFVCSYNINKNEIIKKYYLDRLFDNFNNDHSPKHYLGIIIIEDDDNIKYIKLILIQINRLLHNNNYKSFVRNNTNYGKESFFNIKESIIYGLFIINSNNINNFIINQFIKYIFDSLINMFNSINQKKLNNKNNCKIIIDKIYHELMVNENYQIIDNSKINSIIIIISYIRNSNTISNKKLKIINKLLECII